jgi:phosphate transport system substrate-binding protein
MSFRSLKRFRRVSIGGAAVLSLVAFAACDYSPDGDQDVLAFAGSDTTDDVMTAVIANYNADTTYNNDENTPADDRDILRNVRAVQSTALNVPADEHCGSITYHSPPGASEVVAPNGSSAGRNALRTSVNAGDGCIDIARSSGPPRAIGPTGDLATFEYYAFGLDAMGWASASTLAPANLTHAQFLGIFNCTFTNWNQVGGSNGQIQRYWPQNGSGTYQFAVSDLNNGVDPNTISTPSCPPVINTQENSGALIAANGHQQSALVPYSGGNWVAQARGTQTDTRNGQTIRNLDGQNITRFDDGQWELSAEDAEFPSAPVRESNVKLLDPTPDYVGIRYVWNVIDSTSVSYTSAKRYVGFDNVADGPTSPLCSGGLGTTASVESLGFGRLTNANSSHNLANSLCRMWVPT